MNRDPKIDAYILLAQPFAQPILAHIRKIVHKACSQVQETMKWGFPHFDYKGKMLCSMAAFKQHSAFTFWHGTQIKSLQPYIKTSAEEKGMGQLGKITTIKELPAATELIKMIREAMELTDKGQVSKRGSQAKSIEIVVPEDLATALAKNKKASAVFTNFPPSHRKEYIQWITQAKTEETRQKRMNTALEWIAEEKGRNWKYERKNPFPGKK